MRAQTDRGFLMVALLVGMGIMAIAMSAALPAWRQQMQRERELELVFRGEQYARAIMLYQDKNQNANPPSIDILVSQHYLRKKWKDPITNAEFMPVGIGVVSGGPGQGPPAGQQPARGGQPIGGGQPTGGAPISGTGQPGITGVRSQSNAQSIIVYQQQQVHSQWPFDAARLRANLGMGMPPQQPQSGRDGGPGRGRDGGAGPGRGGPPAPPGQGVTPPGRGGGPGGGQPAVPIGRGGGDRR